MPYSGTAEEIRAKHAAYQRAWRAKHPDRSKAISRKHYWNYPERNRERCRWNTLRWNYGITKQTFDEMNASQGGLCAICHQPPTPIKDKKTRLYIDHEHSSGTVRELLCTKCNHLLGDCKESIKTLEAAIAYLKKWGA